MRLEITADAGEAVACGWPGPARGRLPVRRCSCGCGAPHGRSPRPACRMSSAVPAPGPGFPRPGRTGCGTPRRPGMTRGLAGRWPRSGASCGTPSPARPRSTPRPTCWRCRRWHGRGREDHDEPAQLSCRGLSGDAAGPGLQAGEGGPALRISPPSPKPPEPARSPPTSRSRGRSCPRTQARYGQRSGWAWCAASPATCKPSTRQPRSRPPGCCRPGPAASRPTSTPTLKSPR